jgi:CheY-like chemotaxis protein
MDQGMSDKIELLAAVKRETASAYYKQLTAQKNYAVQIVTEFEAALEVLAERDIDVLVLDHALGSIFDLVAEIRTTYSQLLIVLVDQDADFALPGHADDITTDPFTNDDLIRRISRLISDRQLQTLRADAMPAVREFAKQLRKNSGEYGKHQAAVSACRELGFDYVAFYRIETLAPLTVRVKAQDGDKTLQAAAPVEANADDIIGWVAKTGQTRTVNTGDTLSHPLIQHGRLAAVACVAVGLASRYGVLVAGRVEPNSIQQENVLILELISAQLAAAVSRETVP